VSPLSVVRIVQGPRSVKTGDDGKINKLQKCLKNTSYFTLMSYSKDGGPVGKHRFGQPNKLE
jgi:hypothetical protein